mgnify:CR=1 FL=1
MWSLFHKFGSPPWLYRLSGSILRWLLPITIIALVVGAVWGVLFTPPDFRQGMRACAPIGAALTFVALVTGSIWGKPTWGTWWVWDARITSMLILFFLYLGVVALYEAYENKELAAKACAVLSLVGTVNIPIIYKSVDWTIDPSMLYPLLFMIIAFYALFTCALLMNMRAEIVQREQRTAWVRRLAGSGEPD